jgi:feruloyl esterase
MGHCTGGPGPNWFGQLGTVTAKGPKHGIYDALEDWVEKGTPPAEIIATKYENDSPHGKVEMTRPLCPYPQQIKYNGSGDTNEYSSFSCVAP